MNFKNILINQNQIVSIIQIDTRKIEITDTMGDIHEFTYDSESETSDVFARMTKGFTLAHLIVKD